MSSHLALFVGGASEYLKELFYIFLIFTGTSYYCNDVQSNACGFRPKLISKARLVILPIWICRTGRRDATWNADSTWSNNDNEGVG
jgi:hypothetical protein